MIAKFVLPSVNPVIILQIIVSSVLIVNWCLLCAKMKLRNLHFSFKSVLMEKNNLFSVIDSAILVKMNHLIA